ncbi:MAG: hypothetical protein AAFU34_16985 [Pseudomonadota bacterium]
MAKDTPEEFHSFKEFHYELDLLFRDDVALGKLRQKSRNWCIRNNRAGDDQEVLQEAVLRVMKSEITGTRRWPKGVALIDFLSGVMRSIASEHPKIGFRKNTDKDLEAAKDIASSCNQEGQLFEKEFMARFMVLFEGDDDAQLYLLALEEGQSKSEIMTGFDWNEKEYNTVVQRVKRTRNTHPEMKEMLDGEG